MSNPSSQPTTPNRSASRSRSIRTRSQSRDSATSAGTDLSEDPTSLEMEMPSDQELANQDPVSPNPDAIEVQALVEETPQEDSKKEDSRKENEKKKRKSRSNSRTRKRTSTPDPKPPRRPKSPKSPKKEKKKQVSKKSHPKKEEERRKKEDSKREERRRRSRERKRREETENEESSEDDVQYLHNDPVYGYLVNAPEYELAKYLSRLIQLTQKTLAPKLQETNKARYRVQLKQLHNELPIHMHNLHTKTHAKTKKDVDRSFANQLYEDMVIRSQNMKDDIRLDFSKYQKTERERRLEPKYASGWDLNRDRNKPDKELYSTVHQVLKDKYGCRKLVIEDPVPLRNFLMDLRNSTYESKLAPSQVMSLCQMGFADRTLECFRVLYKQGELALTKPPDPVQPHPIASAVAKLSLMLPTNYMHIVSLVDDFWSMELGLRQFLPDTVNTTIATLSQLALLAYETAPQSVRDDIIKIKVAMSVPKEVRLLIFQHEAARRQNGDELLSETELYDFMRFLAGRGSRGGFRQDPRRVRRPDQQDVSKHGVFKTYALLKGIKFDNVKDEIAYIDKQEQLRLLEPQPKPNECVEPSPFPNALLQWQERQEEALQEQVALLKGLPFQMAQTFVDQLKAQANASVSQSGYHTPLSVAALDFQEPAPSIDEFEASDAEAKFANEVTSSTPEKSNATNAPSEEKDETKKMRKGAGKYISRTDPSWDFYHKNFREQNTYKDSQGFRKFWENQVRKIGLTPWWPDVSKPCPKDKQNRFISEMKRYPKDSPLLYKVGEVILVARAYIKLMADHRVSFCCGRSDCGMVTCQSTNPILSFCTKCEIGYHASSTCVLVPKDEADLPSN